jgi:2-succinyl-5-enolpyruvyl-6-hydroxy-3-cyclohexene-1-carboxylate synthase
MPVRDFDMYSSGLPGNSSISANRGASGIDGTLACAAGFAAGLKKPVTLVLGDLALVHDLNSLALLTSSAFPVTVIVINNQGGGIFSFLPVSKYPHVFEPYFGTPHQFTFKQAAAMFGLRYSQPQTVKDFVHQYKKYSRTEKSTLIEIGTDRKKNFSLHRDLQNIIRNNLENI